MKVPSGSGVDAARRGRRILSLDGGGIRGIMELVILKELEHKTGRKIHELFDLVAGTSTGGIIALVLGLNLQGVGAGNAMDESQTLIDRTLVLYQKLATEVFGSGHWWDVVTRSYREYVAKGGAAYSSDKLATLMKDNMKPQKDVSFDRPLSEFEEALPEHPKCKAFTVATCSYGAEFRAYLFRSYKNDVHVDEWGLARQPTFHGLLGSQWGIAPCLWEAARGTSAAPTYFEPLLLHATDTDEQKADKNHVPQSHQVAFVDGGMVANNPTQIAMFEAHSIWPEDTIDCVVSLGSGSNLEKEIKSIIDVNSGFFKAASKIGYESGILWGNNAVNIATDSEGTHFEVRNWIAMGREETAYFRFNPQNLIDNIDLAEYRLDKIKEMLDKAAEFMKDTIIQQELDVLVEILLEKPGWHDKLREYRRHGVPGIKGRPHAARIDEKL